MYINFISNYNDLNDIFNNIIGYQKHKIKKKQYGWYLTQYY